MTRNTTNKTSYEGENLLALYSEENVSFVFTGGSFDLDRQILGDMVGYEPTDSLKPTFRTPKYIGRSLLKEDIPSQIKFVPTSDTDKIDFVDNVESVAVVGGDTPARVNFYVDSLENSTKIDFSNYSNKVYSNRGISGGYLSFTTDELLSQFGDLDGDNLGFDVLRVRKTDKARLSPGVNYDSLNSEYLDFTYVESIDTYFVDLRDFSYDSWINASDAPVLNDFITVDYEIRDPENIVTNFTAQAKFRVEAPTEDYILPPDPFTNPGAYNPSVVEAGVEGEDYIYGGVQINDTNNNWGRRGFNEAGDYWVKVKNQTDDPLIGNGQEIALVMGSADTIFGTNIQTEDILTGLQEGTLITTKSWTSYDGIFNIASFDGAEVQSLIDSGDTLRITRVDATTGEQIGNTQLFDETLMYGDFDQNYNNSLSAGNDFNYADILAANVDPII